MHRRRHGPAAKAAGREREEVGEFHVRVRNDGVMTPRLQTLFQKEISGARQSGTVLQHFTPAAVLA
jgi:hypothetical protein